MDKNRDYSKILKTLAKWAGIFSIAVGVLVMAGWVLNIDFLKGLGPNFISMKVNTAICFILLGLSLYLQIEYQKVRVARIATYIFNAIVLAIAMATLGEYIYGWDLSIDQAIFRDASAVSAAFPGRMALVTIVNFILLSVSFLIKDNKKDVDVVNDFIIVFVFFSSLFYLNEYIFQDPSLHIDTGFIPLALNTSITFLILSLGIKMMNPDRGILRVLVTGNLGGNIARKILPAIIFLPTLIALVESILEKTGILSDYYAHAGLGVLNALILGGVVLYNAYLINDAENARGKDIGLRQQAEVNLEKAIAEIKEKNEELERSNKMFIQRELDRIKEKSG